MSPSRIPCAVCRRKRCCCPPAPVPVSVKLPVVPPEEVHEGCRYGNKESEPHTCPYAEDVNGDHTTLCVCCVECQNDCYQDI